MEGERQFGATAARLRDAVRAAMTGMTLAPQLKGGGGDGGGGGGVGPTPSVTDETFVREAVFSAVQATIGDKLYSHAHTEQWTNAIVEMLVMRLVSIDRDYKYVTTCMIVQKTGAGMRSATSCFWNAETDHGHSITMEHGDMYVITTIFVCKA
jgi:dynein light chain Tctex-type 1